MFHKFCVFMALVGIVGIANAAENIPQVLTSEVFYDSEDMQDDIVVKEPVYEIYEYDEDLDKIGEVPVWPLIGSEADVTIACGELGCKNNEAKVVSKVGSGLVIENNITTNGTGWSGGPNIMNGAPIPAGFDYECANSAEMPLMRREMMEDDGGTVLAVSRSGRKNCNKSQDSYAVFAQRAGFSADKPETSGAIAVEKEIEFANETNIATKEKDVKVNDYVEEEAPRQVSDQVRSWVVASGQTLRQVLQSWCDKEGWDLVWTTSREYPIEASAVFKGRFVDVASALIRNFERATPIPYAKFYKGNRVIVVSTAEE